MRSLIQKTGLALDSFGRDFLSSFDYRLYGLLALVALSLFCMWRKWRYESYPTSQDCQDFVIGMIGVVGGIIIMVVFLFTSPPAIDMLSHQALALIGTLVPIVLVGKAGLQLKALIFPPQAPKPPKD